METNGNTMETNGNTMETNGNTTETNGNTTETNGNQLGPPLPPKTGPKPPKTQPKPLDPEKLHFFHLFFSYKPLRKHCFRPPCFWVPNCRFFTLFSTPKNPINPRAPPIFLCKKCVEKRHISHFFRPPSPRRNLVLNPLFFAPKKIPPKTAFSHFFY